MGVCGASSASPGGPNRGNYLPRYREQNSFSLGSPTPANQVNRALKVVKTEGSRPTATELGPLFSFVESKVQ